MEFLCARLFVKLTPNCIDVLKILRTEFGFQEKMVHTTAKQALLF